MKDEEKNVAYIDGANLYMGVSSQRWILDYARFRRWLKEKYKVKHAYLFLGMIPKYHAKYKVLQEAGFILVFKEVVYDKEGKAKGNCDADLVLQAVQDFYLKKYERIILVSSDGDYASMVKLFLDHHVMAAVVSPASEGKCSILLKRTGARITYLGQIRSLIEVKKEKAPDTDKTV